MPKINNKDVIVFDLETQRSFEEVGGRHNLEKLKISLAGIYSFQKDSFLIFLENELKKLEKILQEAALVVGFNIRKFDYPVLAPYMSFDPRTLPSLDIMQEIEQQVGHRVSLDSVAQATLNCCKSGNGLEAIKLYRQGKIEELKQYCLDDVRITRDVFSFGCQKKRIYFSSNYGDKVTVGVHWQLPQISHFSKKEKSSKEKNTSKRSIGVDDFELIDIYQSLLVRRAIGEFTENDDESGIIEKIEKVIDAKDLEYCQERTREVMESLEEALSNSYKNNEDFNDYYYPRNKSKGFKIDESLENDLKKAFTEKKRIEINYESKSTQAGEPFLKKRQVDIYEIHGGYFQGFCHLRKEVRQFRMDRVVNFKVLSAKYKIPKDWQSL